MFGCLFPSRRLLHCDKHACCVQAAGSSITFVMLLEALQQALSGLHYLHTLGIMHRDFRTANILVSSRDPLCVMVADFGLSHQLSRYTKRSCLYLFRIALLPSHCAVSVSRYADSYKQTCIRPLRHHLEPALMLLVHCPWVLSTFWHPR